MWKRSRHYTFVEFVFNYPSVALPEQATHPTWMRGLFTAVPLAKLLHFECLCVCLLIQTAAAALLIGLQHATVIFDGAGKPATNQDECYTSHKSTVLIGGCSLET